jgi:hypothetical protein
MPAKRLNLIEPGSPVTIGESIPATVTSISIGPNNHTQYHVAWWDGNSRQAEWLEECEVQPASNTTTAIGFKK